MNIQTNKGKPSCGVCTAVHAAVAAKEQEGFVPNFGTYINVYRRPVSYPLCPAAKQSKRGAHVPVLLSKKEGAE